MVESRHKENLVENETNHSQNPQVNPNQAQLKQIDSITRGQKEPKSASATKTGINSNSSLNLSFGGEISKKGEKIKNSPSRQLPSSTSKMSNKSDSQQSKSNSSKQANYNQKAQQFNTDSKKSTSKDITDFNDTSQNQPNQSALQKPSEALSSVKSYNELENSQNDTSFSTLTRNTPSKNNRPSLMKSPSQVSLVEARDQAFQNRHKVQELESALSLIEKKLILAEGRARETDHRATARILQTQVESQKLQFKIQKLETEVDDSRRQIESLRQTHSEQLRELQERHTDEQTRANEEVRTQFQSQIDQIRTSHQREKENLQQMAYSSRKELELLRLDHSELIRNTKFDEQKESVEALAAAEMHIEHLQGQLENQQALNAQREVEYSQIIEQLTQKVNTAELNSKTEETRRDFKEKELGQKIVTLESKLEKVTSQKEEAMQTKLEKISEQCALLFDHVSQGNINDLSRSGLGNFDQFNHTGTPLQLPAMARLSSDRSQMIFTNGLQASIPGQNEENGAGDQTFKQQNSEANLLRRVVSPDLRNQRQKRLGPNQFESGAQSPRGGQGLNSYNQNQQTNDLRIWQMKSDNAQRQNSREYDQMGKKHKRIPSDLEGLTRMFSNNEDMEVTDNNLAGSTAADQALFHSQMLHNNLRGTTPNSGKNQTQSRIQNTSLILDDLGQPTTSLLHQQPYPLLDYYPEYQMLRTLKFLTNSFQCKCCEQDLSFEKFFDQSHSACLKEATTNMEGGRDVMMRSVQNNADRPTFYSIPTIETRKEEEENTTTLKEFQDKSDAALTSIKQLQQEKGDPGIVNLSNKQRSLFNAKEGRKSVRYEDDQANSEKEEEGSPEKLLTSNDNTNGSPQINQQKQVGTESIDVISQSTGSNIQYDSRQKRVGAGEIGFDWSSLGQQPGVQQYYQSTQQSRNGVPLPTLGVDPNFNNQSPPDLNKPLHQQQFQNGSSNYQRVKPISFAAIGQNLNQKGNDQLESFSPRNHQYQHNTNQVRQQQTGENDSQDVTDTQQSAMLMRSSQDPSVIVRNNNNHLQNSGYMSIDPAFLNSDTDMKAFNFQGAQNVNHNHGLKSSGILSMSNSQQPYPQNCEVHLAQIKELRAIIEKLKADITRSKVENESLIFDLRDSKTKLAMLEESKAQLQIELNKERKRNLQKGRGRGASTRSDISAARQAAMAEQAMPSAQQTTVIRRMNSPNPAALNTSTNSWLGALGRQANQNNLVQKANLNNNLVQDQVEAQQARLLSARQNQGVPTQHDMSSFTEKMQGDGFQTEIDMYGKNNLRQTERTPISQLLAKNTRMTQVSKIDEGSEDQQSQQLFDHLNRSQNFPPSSSTHASRMIAHENLNRSTNAFRSPQTNQRMIPLAQKFSAFPATEHKSQLFDTTSQVSRSQTARQTHLSGRERSRGRSTSKYHNAWVANMAAQQDQKLGAKMQQNPAVDSGPLLPQPMLQTEDMDISLRRSKLEEQFGYRDHQQELVSQEGGLPFQNLAQNRVYKEGKQSATGRFLSDKKSLMTIDDLTSPKYSVPSKLIQKQQTGSFPVERKKSRLTNDTPIRESAVLHSPTPLRKDDQGIHAFSSSGRRNEEKEDTNLQVHHNQNENRHILNASDQFSDTEDEANLDEIDESQPDVASSNHMNNPLQTPGDAEGDPRLSLIFSSSNHQKHGSLQQQIINNSNSNPYSVKGGSFSQQAALMFKQEGRPTGSLLLQTSASGRSRQDFSSNLSLINRAPQTPHKKATLMGSLTGLVADSTPTDNVMVETFEPKSDPFQKKNRPGLFNYGPSAFDENLRSHHNDNNINSEDSEEISSNLERSEKQIELLSREEQREKEARHGAENFSKVAKMASLDSNSKNGQVVNMIASKSKKKKVAKKVQNNFPNITPPTFKNKSSVIESQQPVTKSAQNQQHTTLSAFKLAAGAGGVFSGSDPKSKQTISSQAAIKQSSKRFETAQGAPKKKQSTSKNSNPSTQNAAFQTGQQMVTQQQLLRKVPTSTDIVSMQKKGKNLGEVGEARGASGSNLTVINSARSAKILSVSKHGSSGQQLDSKEKSKKQS